jgi:hypothetical protein
MTRLGALALIAVALTACGSATTLSPATYRTSLAQIATQADQAQTDVEKGLQAKTLNQLRATLTMFAHKDEQLSNEFASLHPPSNAVAANAALERAEHDQADMVRALLPHIAHANSVRTAIALLQADPQAAATGRQLDSALAQLRRLGYAKRTR